MYIYIYNLYMYIDKYTNIYIYISKNVIYIYIQWWEYIQYIQYIYNIKDILICRIIHIYIYTLYIYTLYIYMHVLNIYIYYYLNKMNRMKKQNI